MLDPDIQNFDRNIETQNLPPISSLPVSQARHNLITLQKAELYDLPISTRDYTLYLRDSRYLYLVPGLTEGYSSNYVSFRIYRPSTADDVLLPFLLYCHGGGFVTGNIETHDRLARELAIGADIAVVLVDYALSPEFRYPTALIQIHTLLKFLYNRGRDLGLNPNKIAIGGDSAGANLAFVVTLMDKYQRGLRGRLPVISFQLLFYPVTSSEMNTQSYARYENGPWLTRNAMEYFWNAYEPNINRRRHASISPLNATIEQLRGLPPTLIIVAGHDVLRDEGIALMNKLKEAGVAVLGVEFPEQFMIS